MSSRALLAMKTCRYLLTSVAVVICLISIRGIAISQTPQETAERFAPRLRFDQTQGSDDLCFPGNPNEYYQIRILGGQTNRICNPSYTGIMAGKIPVYYQYQRCTAGVSQTNEDTRRNCVPLLTPETASVGMVCIDDVTGEGNATVTYTIQDGWELLQTNLWFGETLSDIPKTKTGDPDIREFPYQFHHVEGEGPYSFNIENWPVCKDTTYVAANAVVHGGKHGERGVETAWASGPRIVDESGWATFFTLEPADLKYPCPPRSGITEYVMYWFFYGYQHDCDCCSGEHDSDWERIVVKIVDGVLDRVMYYQHKGNYTRVSGHFSLVPGSTTHPIAYVGKTAHGSYHDDGGSGTCCYYEDWRNPDSEDQYMDTWLNLKPLDGSEAWMNYSGCWGGDCITGPLFRTEDTNFCALPGCRGHSYQVCDTCGCSKSDIGSNIF